MRNKYFRLAAKDPAFSAVATLMGGGYFQDDLRNRLSSFREQIVTTAETNRYEDKLKSRLKEALGESLQLIASLSAEQLSTQEKHALRIHIDPAVRLDTIEDVDTVTKALYSVKRLKPAVTQPEISKQGGSPKLAKEQAPTPLKASAMWVSGSFDDGWVDHKSKISVQGAKTAQITAWLPASENKSEKTLDILNGGDLLGSFEINRGETTVITIEIPEGTSGLIDLVCDYPERAKGDEVRLLGFVCVDLIAL